MRLRHVSVGLLAALIIGAAAGCKQSPGEGKSSRDQGETIARIHWLGKDRISAETNANGFMSIWKMLETAKLEAQTLDKLAAAPWRLLDLAAPLAVTNPQPSAIRSPLSDSLRPLLDDLVLNECGLEARQITNQPGELAFAIRLNAERAGLWETNLAAVLASLTGATPTPDAGGWRLQLTNHPSSVRLTRAGDWTLLSLGQPEHNAPLADMLARIQSLHSPFAAGATNYWLEAAFDLQRLAAAFSLPWRLPADFPRITLTATGDGENVLTRVELSFSRPLDLPLEPWNVPTNLIRGSLTSFTALRGVRPWLSACKWLENFQIAPLPNHFYVWAIKAPPFATSVAVPMPYATAVLERTGPQAVAELNPWVTNHAFGSLAYSSDEKTVTWSSVPIATPALRGVEGAGGDFLIAGLAKDTPGPTSSQLSDMMSRMAGSTNLLYFDREATGERVQQWLFMSQLARVICRRPQIPTNAISLHFLTAIAPRLISTATEVHQTSPATISLARKSQAGLTAIELNLLADWLESPSFPRRLRTLEAPTSRMSVGRPRTNTFPQTVPPPPRR